MGPHIRFWEVVAFFLTSGVSLTLAARVGEASGPGWPHWRGPHYTGSCRSPVAWRSAGWESKPPKVAWTIELGATYNTGVGLDNRVCAVGGVDEQGRPTNEKQAKPVLYCLSLEDGAVRWSLLCGEGAIPGRYGLHYSTPGLSPDGRVVVAAMETPLVICAETASGRKRWSVKPPLPCGGGSSPLVLDDRVVLPIRDPRGMQGCLIALSLKDGTVLWQGERRPLSSLWSSPVPLIRQGQTYVLIATGTALYAHSADTGRIAGTHDPYGWRADGLDKMSAEVQAMYRRPFLQMRNPATATGKQKEECKGWNNRGYPTPFIACSPIPLGESVITPLNLEHYHPWRLWLGIGLDQSVPKERFRLLDMRHYWVSIVAWDGCLYGGDQPARDFVEPRSKGVGRWPCYDAASLDSHGGKCN
jgi:hypothetical protein